MQKKYLIMLGLLLIFITGCKMSPFNVEAKVNYVSREIKGDTLASKTIVVTVDLLNSVYIDGIKEVKATVNGVEVSLKYDDNEINGDNKKIVIYPFTKADGTAITPLTSNTIQITAIRLKDENGNSVTMSGKVDEVKITESGSSGDESGTTLDPVTGLKAELKSTTNGYQVELSWAENTLAKKGYRVYRTVTTDGIFDSSKEKRIDYTGAETTAAVVTTSMESFTDPKAQAAGSTVFYRVTAYDGTDETNRQDKAVGIKIIETSTTVTISNVTGLTVEKDADSVLLEWAAATATGTNIIGYNIYGCETINGTFIKMTSIGTTDVTAQVVNSETTKIKIPVNTKFGALTFTTVKPMYMKVKAVGLNGEEGTFSAPITATMYDGTVPTLKASTEIKLVPYGNDDSGITVTKLGAKLEWVNIAGVKSYKIERASSATGTYSEITEVAASAIGSGKTNYIDGSLMELSSKTAYYRIRCVSTNSAVGRPSGTVHLTDESNMLTPEITTKANWLELISTSVGATSSTYTFAYLDISDPANPKPAEVTGMPLDFAGYKMYMSNTFDGEFFLVGKVSGLGGATVTVPKTIIDPTKPIFVRCSTYDYFGNESGLSLRTDNIQ